MTQSNQPPDNNNIIQITKSDAESKHVDDLLKRQASLRGDTGISRDTGKRWFYQNWFVLGLAGLLAAIMCWGILRIGMRDKVYVQGNIEKISDPAPDDPFYIESRVKVADMDYKIVTVVRQPDGPNKWKRFDVSELKQGQTVGLYVDYFKENEVRAGSPPGWVVTHIDPAPPASDSATSDFRTALAHHQLWEELFFPAAGALIGLWIGAADGIMCRLPRRIFIAGGLGLLVGFVGAFIASLLSDRIYDLFNTWALKNHAAGGSGFSGFGLFLQITARSLAWAMAGSAMGLGQGLALRSGRILVYGLLGGLIGGLFGGLLFDPIVMVFPDNGAPDNHLPRLISLCFIGLSVGGMIGVVELLARDAWLRMVAGPLAGKEFLIFKNTMNVGASPKSDIYLFNDAGVAAQHAVLRATGDAYEIEAISELHPLTINGRAIRRGRLRHGDQIGLGRTVFVFQRKTG